MAVGRNAHAQALLGNGDVIVGGGVGDANGKGLTATAERYEFATGQWSDLEAMPYAVEHHRVLTLPDGNVIVIGGISREGSEHLARNTIVRSVFDDITPTGIVSGSVWYDMDGNGQNGLSDIEAADVQLVANPGRYLTNTDANGKYKLELPAGQYEICLAENSNWRAEWTNSDSECYLIEIVAFGQKFEQRDFGLSAKREVQDLDISLVSSQAVSGEELTYFLTIRNAGASAYSGYVQLEYDAAIEYLNSSTNPSSLENGRLRWNLQDFAVGRILTLEVVFTIPDNQALLGSEICAEASFLKEFDVELHRGGWDQYCTTILEARISDLLSVSPRGQGLAGIMFYEEGLLLRFTQYFQNTGAEIVQDVAITTYLDEALDYNSFELGATSHPATASLNADGFVQISLEDVNLAPASASEQDSHGFVHFNVKPKNPGDGIVEFSHLCRIAMDLRNPVQSNSVNTAIIGVISSVDEREHAEFELNIHPNPASEKCSVSGIPDRIQSARLYNMLGQTVPFTWSQEAGKDQSLLIDAAPLQAGVYLLSIDCGAAGRTTAVLRVVP